jgi:hypothetical protein
MIKVKEAHKLTKAEGFKKIFIISQFLFILSFILFIYFDKFLYLMGPSPLSLSYIFYLPKIAFVIYLLFLALVFLSPLTIAFLLRGFSFKARKLALLSVIISIFFIFSHTYLKYANFLSEGFSFRPQVFVATLFMTFLLLFQLLALTLFGRLFVEEEDRLTVKSKKIFASIYFLIGLFLASFVTFLGIGLKERPFPGYSKIKTSNPVIFELPMGFKYTNVRPFPSPSDNPSSSLFYSIWEAKTFSRGNDIIITQAKKGNEDLSLVGLYEEINLENTEIIQEKDNAYVYINNQDSPDPNQRLIFDYGDRRIEIIHFASEDSKQFLLDLASTAYQLN